MNNTPTQRYYFIEVVLEAESMDEARDALRGIDPKFSPAIVSSREGEEVEDEPTFYCPRCGMGGADHTDAEFDCVALQTRDDA